jgi:tRNA pseudouridine55 synthase
MSVPLSIRGVFSVWKPRGVTSAQVVNQLKSTIITNLDHQNGKSVEKKLKIGHGGTLDKDAEGVLVIGVGEGCKKLSEYLNNGLKEYTATGKLGEATDTYDSTGTIVKTSSYEHVDKAAIMKHIRTFTGHFEQSPPVFSALKSKGKRLSDRVRRGEDVSRPQPRPVVVHSITLDCYNPPLFSVSVVCRSGFYVRSFIHDLGVVMGTSAHMTHLQRTADGPFTSSQSLRESDWTRELLFKHLHIQFAPTLASDT